MQNSHGISWNLKEDHCVGAQSMFMKEKSLLQFVMMRSY